MSETNRVRLRPERKHGHIEIYTLKAIEPQPRRRALWLHFALYRPTRAGKTTVGECWAVVHDAGKGRKWAAKRVLPLGHCSFGDDGFSLGFASCLLDDRGSSGVLPGEVDLGWDLQYASQAGPTEAPLMEVQPVVGFGIETPRPNARVNGEVRVGDETWAVESWPAMQGHRWGRRYPLRSAWAHCNDFDGHPDAWFEGFSASMAVGPIRTPLSTSLRLHYEGQDIQFESLRQMWKRGADMGHLFWRFEALQKPWTLRGVVQARRRQTAGIFRFDTNGEPTNNLSSAVAQADIFLLRSDGTREVPVAQLISPNAAALELIDPSPAHGVMMLL